MEIEDDRIGIRCAYPMRLNTASMRDFDIDSVGCYGSFLAQGDISCGCAGKQVSRLRYRDAFERTLDDSV